MNYSSLRAVVIRENWLGCTGISAASALMRLGVGVQSLTETEFVPIRWKSLPMRALGKSIRGAAVREFNVHLVRLAETFRPHLFLATKGTFVSWRSLRRLKEMGVTCLCYYPDPSFVAYGPYLPRALPEYDWIFTTKSFGCADLRTHFGSETCSYLPHAYDPDVHRPRTPGPERIREYSCDMSFIGSWSQGKEATLTEIVRLMPEISLKIWGDRWHNVDKKSSLRPFLQHCSVTGSSYAEAIGCSKINLALLQEQIRGGSSGDQITSRTFHIPASGGFMLHGRNRDLLDIFTEDVDCAAFDGAEEVVEQAKRFLRDDTKRKQIAEQGRRLVESSHSWDHRVKTILDRYFGIVEAARLHDPSERIVAHQGM
jgi:spore maturation protein CgeB